MLREYELLFPHIRRYRWSYILGSACILGSILLKLAIPALIGSTVDAVRGDADLGDAVRGDADLGDAVRGDAAAGEALEAAVADGTGGELADVVLRNSLLIGGIALAISVVRTQSRLQLLGTSRRSVHDLRRELFDHLTTLSPAFYVRHQTGDIMSRCVNDARNVQGLLGPVFMYLTETGAIYAFGVPLMLRIDPWLAAIAVLPFPFFIFRARQLARRIQEGSRAAQQGLADVNAKVDESLSGQLVIKTMALEDFDRERFRHHCDEYRRLNLDVARARSALIPLMIGLGSLCALILLAVGGPLVASGRVSLGDFVALNFYLQLLAAPAGTLGFVMSSLQSGAAALGRIREVLEMRPTLVDPPVPDAEKPSAGAVSVRGLRVVWPPLDEQPHLSGALPPALAADLRRERVVLDGVSFEVAAGETVGIVGHTGSGKSTLLAALSRQLEIEPGQVFLDGVDVTTMRVSDVRRSIGFVPQDGYLFSTTLRANVGLGREQASDAEIDAAVEAAQLSKDLPQLPDGLATMVGERGVNLSGGQRQRAGLARALVRDPEILMLDDSLSAVDAHTADEILQRLEPWMEGRTTLLVAHRVATVQRADKILVLEEGRIVESGTHAELLALGGRYAALHAVQQLEQALEGA